MSEIYVTTKSDEIQSSESRENPTEIEYRPDGCFVCGNPVRHLIIEPDGKTTGLCDGCYYLFGYDEHTGGPNGHHS